MAHVQDQGQMEVGPFEAVSANMKYGEDAISITFGSMGLIIFRHGVHDVRAIRVRPLSALARAALQVVAQGGTKPLVGQHTESFFGLRAESTSIPRRRIL